MAIYKQIFPTKYPLLEFNLTIWKLSVRTYLMRESSESMTYEYIRLGFLWGNNMFFHFRLFETQQRKVSRLDGMLSKSKEYTLKELKEIRTVALKEIKKIEKTN